MTLALPRVLECRASIFDTVEQHRGEVDVPVASVGIAHDADARVLVEDDLATLTGADRAVFHILAERLVGLAQRAAAEKVPKRALRVLVDRQPALSVGQDVPSLAVKDGARAPVRGVRVRDGRGVAIVHGLDGVVHQRTHRLAVQLRPLL